MNNTIINIVKVKEDYNIYNTSFSPVYYNITEKNSRLENYHEKNSSDQ